MKNGWGRLPEVPKPERERWFHVQPAEGSAYGFASLFGKVRKAPEQFAWMIGKPLEEIRQHFKKGDIVVEIKS